MEDDIIVFSGNSKLNQKEKDLPGKTEAPGKGKDLPVDEPVCIPEPSSIFLVLIGLIVFALFRMKRVRGFLLLVLALASSEAGAAQLGSFTLISSNQVVNLVSNKTLLYLPYFSAGSSYTVTTNLTNVVFGSTTPELQFTNSGSFLLFSTAVIKYDALELAAAQTITFSLYKTNSPTGYLSDYDLVVTLPIGTNITQGIVVSMPPMLQSTITTNDGYNLHVGLSGELDAGSVLVEKVVLSSLRLQ